DDKQKLEQDYLLDEINDVNDVKKYINYDQQVGKVKDIFANIKERLTEEEQGQAELLEKNALEIMEKLTQGIDY
ncbi:9439_t:CDS:1, partial [Paraglomus brasilianum]